MDKITHNIRREQWTKIINQCLASGMNKTAWCKQNGISDKSFFYWQRKLRLEAADPEQFPAVPTAGTLPQTFIEVRPVPNRKEQHFQPDMIIRKGDVVLEISNSVSPDLLNLLGGILHAE